MSDVVFIDNSIEVKAALKKYEEKFLTEAAYVIESQVKQNTAVDTSNTKKAWQSRVDISNHEAVIGNPLQNAVWEEYGTGEYALNGKGRKGGWVYKIERGRKVTRNKDGKIRKNSKYKYGDGYYFTLGKYPRRALHKAFYAKKGAIILRAQQLAKEELG